MRLAFKTRKSAGIRIEARVFHLIKRADVARDAGQWSEAITGYGAALAMAPRLPHIHIQLGHALKQSARWDEADAAYAEAARRGAGDAEPLLHRAHLAKQRGRFDAALIHFAAILRRQENHAEALAELAALTGHDSPIANDQLRVVLDAVPVALDAPRPAAEVSDETDVARPGGDPLVFDITDLIGHFRHRRLPDGIQRVQMEVVASLLSTGNAASVSTCCFVGGQDCWKEVPLHLCMELIRLSGTGHDVNDPDWQAARTRLFVHLTLAGCYVFPWRAVLINLGTTFWAHDYFRLIRNAKADRRIRYIPLVYDMIPVVRPEYCVPGWIDDFMIWTVGIFRHADAFLAISNSAKSDLLDVADRLGCAVSQDSVEVVPLDADFRRQNAMLPVSALEAWGLCGKGFALLVSTIEPRKNHALALDSWVDLLRRHGPDGVPRLVCVGRDGWMNDDVFDRLDTDPTLAAHVTLLYRVSDAELALLYRESLFTLFPSLYEGWGLPVTESLCHGRVPLIADNSSLPQAGGDLALRFVSGSIGSLVAAVEKVVFEAAWRTAREARIAAEFSPRSWTQVAEQIASSTTRLLDHSDREPEIPPVLLQTFYPVGLHQGREIWTGLASGEMFRVGDGWLWPEPDGCPTKPGGGDLRMRVVEHGDRALRIYLHLRDLEQADCSVEIVAEGVVAGERRLRSGKRAWVACDLPADIGPELRLSIRSRIAESSAGSGSGPDRSQPASVALVGFFLCGRDDEPANSAFIWRRRHGLESISAYAKPSAGDLTPHRP